MVLKCMKPNKKRMFSNINRENYNDTNVLC